MRLEGEGPFLGAWEPDAALCWRLREQGLAYHDSLRLDSTVNTNENFFLGRQWEGVQAKGLPTPVFNILKRDVAFVVATITSDNLAVHVAPTEPEVLPETGAILTAELNALVEENNIVALTRELARDAAVRGDGCLFTWWDPKGGREGAPKTEVVENTRVFFGNPNDRQVESQPWVLIESRVFLREARRTARKHGCTGWRHILPEEPGGEKVTSLLLLWREEESGEIWGYECVKGCTLRPPWSLGLRRYPLVWMNWEPVPDSYHGEAMLTGLIPNQIFINKAWAMSILSLMTTAYPKVIYDRTRIPRWDNRVGAAIAVNGGDMENVAKLLDPAQISPQIAQFIELAIEQTNRNLGATNAALGDVKPENTSAILALQRASATPSEIPKQNLRQAVEELMRIYLDFIGAAYGKRQVLVNGERREVDFALLREKPLRLRVEIGASAYFSEVAALQTLDKLLDKGLITLEEYLNRIPEGYVPAKEGLLRERENDAGREMQSPGA